MIGSLDALRPALPDGARWAPDVVRCDAQIRARRRTGRCATSSSSPDLATAPGIAADNPQLRAVTPDGDVLGAYAAAGGSAKAQSFIEVQAAVEEARAKRADAEESITGLREKLAAARATVARRKEAVATAAAAKRAAEGERNAAARRLAELGAAARSAHAETERLARRPRPGRGGPRPRPRRRSPSWRSGCAAGRDHTGRRGTVHRGA